MIVGSALSLIQTILLRRQFPAELMTVAPLHEPGGARRAPSLFDDLP